MNLILDLETLDTRPSAIITEIGCVAYDADYNVHEQLAIELDIPGQLADFRSFSPDTIAWHRRNGTLPKQWEGTPLDQALEQLNALIRSTQPDELWIWGKDFDRPILDDTYAYHHRHFPIHYSDTHCARDAFHLAFGHIKRKPRTKTHLAIEDCITIMKDLRDVFRKLRP